MITKQSQKLNQASALLFLDAFALQTSLLKRMDQLWNSLKLRCRHKKICGIASGYPQGQNTWQVGQEFVLILGPGLVSRREATQPNSSSRMGSSPPL